MNEHIKLPKNSQLELGGEKYVIAESIGGGGSSVVYKGFRGKEPVIIKELYPKVVRGITRGSDNSLIITDEAKSIMDDYKKRAWMENKIVNKLRLTDNDNDIDTWFKNYHEPMEANNTLYTVIDSEFGDMLDDMMSGKNKGIMFKSFIDVCEHILRILEALEPMHTKGFIHMDITPSNIHILKQAIDNKRIVKLLDFNNSFNPKDDEEGDREILGKEGYYAPELKGLRGTADPKAAELTFAVDLYSVVVIFFELLTDKLPESIDITLLSRNYDVVSEGYLDHMSGLAIKKTNRVLKKGLSKVAENRYQNIEELRSDIKDLIMLAQKTVPRNDRKRQYPHFVARERELDQIHELLKKENHIFLEGMGGIGKTELAKKYANQYRDEYEIIQIITYSESLQETIAFSLKFNNFEKKQYEQLYKKEDIIPKMFDDKIDCLQNNCDEKTLIIIDNFDAAANDDLDRLISGKYKVILTSRQNHHGYNLLELSNMESKSDLMKLFYTYYIYNKPLEKFTAEDETIIYKIMDLVLGHTMTVMLIARSMQVNGISPSDMLARLTNSLDAELTEKICIRKEEIKGEKEREQIMYQHVLNLFDIENIFNDEDTNESCKYIMVNMAIVPYLGIETKKFLHWTSYLFDSEEEYVNFRLSYLESLIDLRWIQFDENESKISLHPVISEVANSKLKPDSENCELLLHSMMEFACDCYEKTFVEQIVAADMLEPACRRLKEESEPVAYMIGAFAFLNESLARYEISLEYYKKYAEMLEKISLLDIFRTNSVNDPAIMRAKESVVRLLNNLGRYDEALKYQTATHQENNDEENMAREFHSMGKVYDNKGDIKSALDYYNRAFEIRKHIYKEDHPLIAQSYNDIGHVYEKLLDHNNALNHFKEALRIALKHFGADSALAATAYSNIGVTLLDMEKPDEAYRYLCKALDIESKLYGKNHPTVAKTHMNFGGYYFMKGDLQKALEKFNESLYIYEEIFPEGHSDIAQLNMLIGSIHFQRREYKEALHCYEKGLSMYRKISGDDSSDTAKAYNDIATVHLRMGAPRLAMANYKLALAIMQRLLPNNHPIIQSIKENIEIARKRI